jgi:hypothetical protein
MGTLPLRSTTLFLLSGVMLCADARAQPLPPVPVNVGDRIRVRLESPPDAPDRYARLQELRGAVTAISALDVAFQVHPDASPLTVPFSAIRRLDVSKGIRSRAHNALVWAAGGAVLGGVSWYYQNDFRASPGFGDDWDSVYVSAAIGAVGGAIMGALWPQERWRKLRLPR